MRWLFALAIVGAAATAHADDGCRVTTPSGQILLVREVAATLRAPVLLRTQPIALEQTKQPVPANPPNRAEQTPPPVSTRDRVARIVTGATLGQLISDPLRRHFGLLPRLDDGQAAPLQFTFHSRFGGVYPTPERVPGIVTLEILLDECAPSEA